jgi:hypothetical protein
MKRPGYCNDYGDAPGCLGEIDPRYTMDFTDVEQGAFIYWCAHCGPRAAAMGQLLDRALQTHGVDTVGALINEAERDRTKH